MADVPRVIAASTGNRHVGGEDQQCSRFQQPQLSEQGIPSRDGRNPRAVPPPQSALLGRLRRITSILRKSVWHGSRLMGKRKIERQRRCYVPAGGESNTHLSRCGEIDQKCATASQKQCRGVTGCSGTASAKQWHTAVRNPGEWLASLPRSPPEVERAWFHRSHHSIGVYHE